MTLTTTPIANAIPDTPLAAAASGLDRCVHCGFCLQACPTYQVLQDENDSPRGRLMLMRAVVEGALPIDEPAVQTHLDRCLGCRGCESACPSGVPYGHLLEAARETMSRTHPLPLTARLVLAVFARPMLLATVLAVAKAVRATGLARVSSGVRGRLGFASAMLAASEPAEAAPYVAEGMGTRGRTGVLEGCVMRGLFDGTNVATIRVLVVNDYDVRPVPDQRCCGALHLHAGDAAGARALARRNIEAFERAGVDHVAVNASGCGAAMKEYGHLLADDPDWRDRAAAFSAKVRDVSELLVEAGPAPGGALGLGPVAYDAPCHLAHVQRVTAAPLALLAAVPDLTIAPLVDADVCCGSAGIYNLIQPDVSNAVLSVKLANIADAKCAVVATGNPGCIMQIGAGLLQRGSAIAVRHPVDLLDASYAARPPRDRAVAPTSASR
ncbi:MAG: heterodisulfide reductase-related iron-sulfur binding cluster [Gemmatimonadaceae bacterium]